MAVRFLIVASPVSMVAVFITLVMLPAVILAKASLVMRYLCLQGDISVKRLYRHVDYTLNLFKIKHPDLII